MSRWEKLIARLYRLDTSLRYEELAKILETYGYEAQETSGGSSHITFRKDGCQPVTIPRHKSIKKTYIEVIRDAVDVASKESDNE